MYKLVWIEADFLYTRPRFGLVNTALVLVRSYTFCLDLASVLPRSRLQILYVNKMQPRVNMINEHVYFYGAKFNTTAFCTFVRQNLFLTSILGCCLVVNSASLLSLPQAPDIASVSS